MEWIRENPAEAAWLLFAILTAVVAAYQRIEGRLKQWADRSPTQIDDAIVGGLSYVLSLIMVLLDFVTHFVPAFASRRRSKPE